MDPTSLPPAPGTPPPPAPAPAGPPTARVRRLGAPLLTLSGVAAAFAYVATVDPNEPGHYPVCPLLRLTGLLCPGCGGLRSAHAFAHGDLATALGNNALGVLAYVLFAGFTALWLVRAWRGGPKPVPVLRPVHWWAVGTVVLAFSVVRNLPFGAALAP
ncbi:DUF2752 domain-containing protein [Streptomyces bambusae]|uniref:DUF2752 domain-containing protein n=1 Tax=Streptomyces bambusae TaxID=1550616 RepID=UPI001CFF0949|nr:DUF2752 domain-containing protein [Streptomyces bambusae]MCB5167821.1 DUF2752 domain-containing protein [Streptomyces bambusae]